MRMIPSLLILVAASALGGCSSTDTTSQGRARDLATTHTCDKYDACGEIAAGVGDFAEVEFIEEGGAAGEVDAELRRNGPGHPASDDGDADDD